MAPREVPLPPPRTGRLVPLPDRARPDWVGRTWSSRASRLSQARQTGFGRVGRPNLVEPGRPTQPSRVGRARQAEFGRVGSGWVGRTRSSRASRAGQAGFGRVGSAGPGRAKQADSAEPDRPSQPSQTDRASRAWQAGFGRAGQAESAEPGKPSRASRVRPSQASRVSRAGQAEPGKPSSAGPGRLTAPAGLGPAWTVPSQVKSTALGRASGQPARTRRSPGESRMTQVRRVESSRVKPGRARARLGVAPVARCLGRRSVDQHGKGVHPVDDRDLAEGQLVGRGGQA